jgi:hypothetical protein
MKYCRYDSESKLKFRNMAETVFVYPTCSLTLTYIQYSKCRFQCGCDLVYYFVGYVNITLDILSIKFCNIKPNEEI